jgi:hypothetical protein
MVAFRIGDIQVASLDDGAFGAVLEAATRAGGPEAFPVLFALPGSNHVVDPLVVVHELTRLSDTDPGARLALLIATLRDDLMEAVAAAGEG